MPNVAANRVEQALQQDGQQAKTDLALVGRATLQPDGDVNAQEYTVAMLQGRYICAKVSIVTDPISGQDPNEVWALVQGPEFDVKATPGTIGGAMATPIKGVKSGNNYIWNNAPAAPAVDGQKLKVEGLGANTYGTFRFVVWYLYANGKSYYIETMRTKITHDSNVNMTDCG